MLTILLWVGAYLACGVVLAALGSLVDGMRGHSQATPLGALIFTSAWPLVFVAMAVIAFHALGQKLRRKDKVQ